VEPSSTASWDGGRSQPQLSIDQHFENKIDHRNLPTIFHRGMMRARKMPSHAAARRDGDGDFDL
jgi:hypothetical protein